ncbi:MAG: hypothetical protein OER86_12455, partial [Phycisphaerae bacterium]|nr:hypothetical protein [Phycisphaerae bacterium]
MKSSLRWVFLLFLGFLASGALADGLIIVHHPIHPPHPPRHPHPPHPPRPWPRPVPPRVYPFAPLSIR